jgi:hypothetical protein
MHLLSVCTCSLAYSLPLKRAPHFMTDNESFVSGRNDFPIPRTNAVYTVSDNLMRMAPERQEIFRGGGRGRFPGNRRLKTGDSLGRITRFFPGWMPKHPAHNNAHRPRGRGDQEDGDWRTGLHAPVDGCASIPAVVKDLGCEVTPLRQPYGGQDEHRSCRRRLAPRGLPRLQIPDDRDKGPEGPLFPGSLPTASHRLQAVQALKRPGR